MPDYKRLVSYIYNYEDGVKRNNVGYARVEARNGQCKCTLHITAPSINDKQLKAYMFQRKKGGPEGILLGVLQIKNGSGDFKIVTDSSHIMNSSYGMEDLGGIVLYLSDRKFFATEWDDSPVTMKMVAEIESKEADKARRLTQEADKAKRSSQETDEAKRLPQGAEKEKRLSQETDKANRLSQETDKVNRLPQEAEKEKRVTEEEEKERRAAKEAEDEKQSSQTAELEQEVKAADIAVLHLDSPSRRRGEEINSRVREAERLRKNEVKEVIKKLQSEQNKSVNLNTEQPELLNNLPEQLFSPQKVPSTEKDLHNQPADFFINPALLKPDENLRGLGNHTQKDYAEKLYTEEPLYTNRTTNTEEALYSGNDVYSEQIGAFNNYGESHNITQKYNTYNNSFDPLNLQYSNPEATNTAGYSSEQIQTGSVQAENNPEQEDVTAEAASPLDVQSEECKKEDSGSFYDDHPIAKRIYRSFPRMYPFEDNEIAWCVKIEPQDIGMFPMEAWILGNNSFLLHGYYSYRHLIFAKINDKNGFNYILGVPGIYHNREKFMAKMFGFENFKCVKRKAQRTGEFGYWYVPIILS